MTERTPLERMRYHLKKQRRKEKYIPKITKIKALFKMQHGKCFYCDKKMDNRSHNETTPNGYTKDHVFPRAQTETEVPYRPGQNIVLSCYQCNSDKADSLPTLDQIRKHNILYFSIANKFQHLR